MDLAARTLDRVEIGEEPSERGHNLQCGGQRASGSELGRKYRKSDDGWFSYEMKVLPDHETALRCTYWGFSTGQRFDVLVDGQKIATQTLNCIKPEFYDVEYRLPKELTAGKSRVTVKFDGHGKSQAGYLFGFATLKSKQ